MQRTVGLAVITGLLAGCSPNLVGNGDVVEDERILQSFAGMYVWGAIRATVTLGIGQEESVKVRTDRNLAKYVTTDVVDGVLEVGGERGRAIEPTHLEVVITAPVMRTIESETWGDVVVDGIDADVLDVGVNHNGTVRILGRATTTNVTSKGNGVFDGRRLMSKDVVLDLNGNGDTYAWAFDSITGQTNGTGTVYVLGSPHEINIRDYGGGDVRGDDE